MATAGAPIHHPGWRGSVATPPRHGVRTGQVLFFAFFILFFSFSKLEHIKFERISNFKQILKFQRISNFEHISKFTIILIFEWMNGFQILKSERIPKFEQISKFVKILAQGLEFNPGYHNLF
jgi:hypothetical protein